VSKDDSAWVVATIEVNLLRSVHGSLNTTELLTCNFLTQRFAEEIYDLRTWGLEVDRSCSSRPKWVFVESLRRFVVRDYVDAGWETDNVA
jgi:hypothetical protein